LLSVAAFLGKSVFEAERDDVRAYVDAQAGNGKSAAQRRNQICALLFLFRRTLGRPECVSFLKLPKVHHALPTVLSVEEVNMLLRAIRSLPCDSVRIRHSLPAPHALSPPRRSGLRSAAFRRWPMHDCQCLRTDETLTTPWGISIGCDQRHQPLGHPGGRLEPTFSCLRASEGSVGTDIFMPLGIRGSVATSFFKPPGIRRVSRPQSICVIRVRIFRHVSSEAHRARFDSRQT